MGDTIWDWSTTAANNATADTSIDWSEGQMPATVNNSAREMMAKIAYMLRDFSSSLTTGGTGDAYTVSPGKAPTSLSDGWIAVVRFDRANTGAATFQVGSLTAADLVDAEGNALSGGEIVAGGIYIVTYNPTSADFHLVNRVPLHSGEVGTTQIANLAVTTAKLAASSVTTAKIADANVTPAKLDSTGAYTVDSLTATTTLLRGTSIIWGDDNFAARIAALTANASPAGTESVACDDGKRVTLQAIADLAGGGTKTAVYRRLAADTSATNYNNYKKVVIDDLTYEGISGLTWDSSSNVFSITEDMSLMVAFYVDKLYYDTTSRNIYGAIFKNGTNIFSTSANVAAMYGLMFYTSIDLVNGDNFDVRVKVSSAYALLPVQENPHRALIALWRL